MTKSGFDALIEAAPTSEERDAAYKTMVEHYKASVLKKIKNYSWDFETFEDENLELMIKSVKMFAFDFLMAPIPEYSVRPYWLTISGKSETGKSHLTMRLGNFLLEHGEEMKVPKFSYDAPQVTKRTCEALKASQVCNDTQTFNAQYKTNLGATSALVLDDLHEGVSDWVKRDLCNILMLRAGEGVDPYLWTVITTNMKWDQVNRLFDPRIASRMRRSSNKIIQLPEDMTAFIDRVKN